MKNRFDFPNLGFGMGLRSQHYPDIVDVWPKEVEWFEVISENFMETDGKPRRILEKIREHYPIAMHGVSLSIGSTDPLDKDYLKKLKAMAAWLEPAWISDHLCWTGAHGINTHELLPVPYTEEALRHIVPRIKAVQDYLERPILLENPSSYLGFRDADMPEWEFLARLATEADCALLLDVNNIYVSAFNHRFDPKTYLGHIPADRVVQIHLAGHEHHGTHIIDTHSDRIVDEVWALYRYAVRRFGAVATMIEWDEKIPLFAVVRDELNKAREQAKQPVDTLPVMETAPQDNNRAGFDYPALLDVFQDSVLEGDTKKSAPEEWIAPKADFSPEAQLAAYTQGYRLRLFKAVAADYPATAHALGNRNFNLWLRTFIETTPSTHSNLGRYAPQFAASLKDHASPFVAELAALEAGLAEIADAEESPPLSADAISALSPEAFLAAKFQPRNASRLFCFDYPVNQYYAAFHEGSQPPIPRPEKTWLLIYRHMDENWRMALEEGEYHLLEALASGLPLQEAVAETGNAAHFDEKGLPQYLQHWLARWLKCGALRIPAESMEEQ